MDHDKLWKALREMGIPDHLTCLLRNLNVVQETAVRTLCVKLIGSRLRQEYHTAVCGHPVCSTYMLRTSQKCWMAEHRLETQYYIHINITIFLPRDTCCVFYYI